MEIPLGDFILQQVLVVIYRLASLDVLSVCSIASLVVAAVLLEVGTGLFVRHGVNAVFFVRNQGHDAELKISVCAL